MKLLSVNVGMPRSVPNGNREIVTGIFKRPVEGRVRVRSLGLEGDGQADLENHGGIYKAVYAYPVQHYSYWAEKLGRGDFAIGQFGENLTVEGISEDQICVGDRIRVGDVILEVTQPRVPCWKLSLKMQIPDFAPTFAASGRTGFYLRVISEGIIQAGDGIEFVDSDPRRVSVQEIMSAKVSRNREIELMKRFLGLPALTPSWRDEFNRRLSEAEASVQNTP